MVNVLFVIIAFLAVTVFVMHAVIKKLKKKLANADDEISELKRTQETLNTEISVLKDLSKKTSENRRKTDEKINSLHSGELSADDILPK